MDRFESDFENELITLINRFSEENSSNTPDFILASYLMQCLSAWNNATQCRETWYGRNGQPCKPTEQKKS